MDDRLADFSGGPNADSDDDGEFEAVDYRFLSALSQKQDYTLPPRGEKDFEPDGTDKQDNSLQASRDAMYRALSVERELTSKTYIRAVWHAERGLGCLNATDARGAMFKGLGKTDAAQNTWLLPEELLFMIERGNLECFYETVDVPMSLQAAYAECIPHVGVDSFQVYSYLKRAGFLVLRPVQDTRHEDSTKRISGGILSVQIWETLRRLKTALWGRGPPKELIDSTKVYRSFTDIYQRLQFVPCHLHDQSSIINENPAINPLQISYNVWKPNSRFKKSNPGPPDFQIAVVNSRSQDVFKLEHFDLLFSSLKQDPGHDKRPQYTRLKVGRKYFVLAVVDMGIVSFLSLGDVSFGNEEMFSIVTSAIKPKRNKSHIKSKGTKGTTAGYQVDSASTGQA